MNALPEWFDWADVDNADSTDGLDAWGRPLTEADDLMRWLLLDKPCNPEKNSCVAEPGPRPLDTRSCTQCGDTFELDPFKGRKRTRCFRCSPTQAGRPATRSQRGDKMLKRQRKLVSLNMTKVDDEEVLDWWEAFDRGEKIVDIAAKWERPVDLVLAKLDDLDVLYGRVDGARFDGGGELDLKLVARALVGDTTPGEERLIAALAKIGRIVEDGPPRQPLPALAPHPVNRRTHVPMSRRERGQNQMASGYWRRIVSRDLARVGLLPRRNRGKTDA